MLAAKLSFSPDRERLRPWLRWRCGAILLALCALLGASSAGEPVRLAALRAAPEVAPVTELPRSEVSNVTQEVHPARRALELNPIHDLSNPAFHQLQRIDEATAHMQRDAIGFPDWMAALRAGEISPRAGLAPGAKMNVLDLDIVMKNTKDMPYVLFPHQSHTLWLDCSNCHPAPFLSKAGANPISMSEIFRGRFCGMCHDRVAFITFFSCQRCHRVPQETVLRQP